MHIKVRTYRLGIQPLTKQCLDVFRDDDELQVINEAEDERDYCNSDGIAGESSSDTDYPEEEDEDEEEEELSGL